ncbi:helix-turn-helix domain-containing protein [Marinomonas pollencensis]|uniref:Cro/C1-type helix-turn-helix DNA-binding protein n=1 Tax=Marinomonas pollencensis TaxID=491954 RepID=A0A3E0DIH1_9GAMM|nr:helix-turn-helix transcriptional regulator [Marinomonas pollencensis]REG81608.1 Cro/C1-type helix-turn-helix DNA-binding protein [Marinomonas pollencensis]
MSDDFKDNLRLLCSYYKSTAEVCRRLGINRPQFNRYLSGTNRPSANTMRRFCEFFGVENHEIVLPHQEFLRLVQTRPVSLKQQSSSVAAAHLSRLNELGQTGLASYYGYYFEYYLSMAHPGEILRTLICIEEHDGHAVYQRTERLLEDGRSKPFHNVYKGMVQFLSGRIFLMDYESLTGVEMTQTILFPSFKSRIDRLNGLRLGVSGSGERMPCCARVVYEYLGEKIDQYRALRQCGLYSRDSEDIDFGIRQSIINQMAPDEWHFRARF